MRIITFEKQVLPYFVIVFLAMYPGVSNAATLRGYLAPVTNLLGTLFPLLITIALIVFFWGVIRYLYAGPNEDLKQNSKRVLTAGVIGIFVIVSVWGIITLVLNLLNLNTGFIPRPIQDFPDSEDIFRFDRN